MSARRRRARALGELRIEITDEDVMESLLWPGPPPGQWRIPPTAHIDALLGTIERRWPR